MKGDEHTRYDPEMLVAPPGAHPTIWALCAYLDQDHRPDTQGRTCVTCGETFPCVPSQTAQRGYQVARGPVWPGTRQALPPARELAACPVAAPAGSDYAAYAQARRDAADRMPWLAGDASPRR